MHTITTKDLKPDYKIKVVGDAKRVKIRVIACEDISQNKVYKGFYPIIS